MCMGSSPSVPATPEVQAAPQEQDAAVVDARDEETRRRRAAAGRSSTLLMGLSSRYSSLSAGNAQNIIDAGGTGTDNTSIWLVVWGENTVHGIFPKGQKAGIQMEDKGQVTLEDANGGKYEGYRTHYKWDNGLTLRDWRYVVRIANIDVSNLDAPSTAANIAKLMIRALHRIPNRGMGRPIFYMNRTINEVLDLQSLEKSSLAISVKETEGEWWTELRGVPIRETDALLETEARVV